MNLTWRTALQGGIRRYLFLVIVFGGCLPPSAQSLAGAGSADIVFENGNVITMFQGEVQAFAVRGDKFLAVGSNRTIAGFKGSKTKEVDLHGATVIPGITDGHDHLWNTQKYLSRGVDLVGVTSLQEMRSRLLAEIAATGPDETIFTTTGWSVTPAPTRRDLDEISSSRSIVLIARRRGNGLLNSAALRKLGISKQNPLFLGTPVPVDSNGEPTGAPPAYPLSVYMIDALLPRMTDEQKDKMVREAMRERNSLGITSIRELAIWPEGVLTLQRMRRNRALTLRIALGIEFPDTQNTAKYLAQIPIDRSDPWLFFDCNAEEPWPPGSASEEEFTALARRENQLGWRPAPHVSADASRGISYDDATEQTLLAYEAADRESSLKGKRWYIEHVPFATSLQIERMGNLGLVVSTQDFGYGTTTAALPASRTEDVNPIRDLLSQNLIVIAGSDYAGPMPSEREPNNPMIPFYFYTTRKNQAGQSPSVRQLISRRQALRLFTVNPAIATFQEKVRGRIAAGMLADFVILNQNLLSVRDEEILSTRPLATYVGGQRVYSAPGNQF